ncbi:MAG: DUF922 domain-containing Zn-dependent protease [Stenotrophomonas sp.]
MRRALLLASLMLTTSFPLAASEQLDITYYPISGKSSKQLLEAMQQHGPEGDDGQRFHGYTRWHVSWKYQTSSRGNRCSITSVDTQVTGTITLPQWTDTQGATEDLLNRWQHYSSLLREHEQGHYQFALDAAAAIRQQLIAMPAQVGCPNLLTQANQLGIALIDEQRQRELAYDRDTDHGRNTGLKL